MLDQMLVAASALPCEAIVIINKTDLACHTVDLTTLADVYHSIGYSVLYTSAKECTGINELETQLANKTTIFVGQSGMGKSSLINILLPHLDIRIGEVSKASSLGKHTTSNTTLYRIDTGGELIDSPGVRDFKPSINSLEQLTRGYIEFSTYLGQCRFRNCTHIVEPGCALKGAAKLGKISPRRFCSYQNLARDLGLVHG
jgi:ribosome biogenesis GTPase